MPWKVSLRGTPTHSQRVQLAASPTAHTGATSAGRWVRRLGLRARSGPGRTGQVTKPAAPGDRPVVTQRHRPGPAGRGATRSPAAQSPGRLSQGDRRTQARGRDRVEPKPGVTPTGSVYGTSRFLPLPLSGDTRRNEPLGTPGAGGDSREARL